MIPPVSCIIRAMSFSMQTEFGDEAAFDVNRTFTRDFDWTVYLVSRGSLRRQLPMEEPDVVTNEDLT